MNLDEVSIFVAVARAGSFAAAAKARTVPKSTLTRALDRLELALGQKLVQRGARKLSLTPVGAAFLARVEPHILGVNDAMQAALDTRDEPAGLLRVTAPTDLGDAFLGEWVVAFSRRFPKVRVEVELTPRLVDLIGEGFDLALRASTKIQDERLVARKLGASWLHCFAAPAYLASHAKLDEPEDLSAHECVLFRPPPKEGSSTWHLRRGHEERRIVVKGPLSGTEFAFVKSVLRAGAGVGFLPAEVGMREVRDGKLVRVLSGWGCESAKIFCVYPASRQLPRKTVVFRDFLCEMFRACEGLGLAT